MDTVVLLMAGVGLSAAAGLRVFAPLLVLSLSALAGWMRLTPSMDFLGTPEAAVILGVATVVEIGAYFVPWLDHLLDGVATPLAVGAGVVLTASVVPDLSPVVRWSFAVIAGGGVAGAVQAKTVVARLLSTATTGGMANFLVAAVEAVGAVGLALLAVLLPLAAFALVAVAGYAAARLLRCGGGATTSGRTATRG